MTLCYIDCVSKYKGKVSQLYPSQTVYYNINHGMYKYVLKLMADYPNYTLRNYGSFLSHIELIALESIEDVQALLTKFIPEFGGVKPRAFHVEAILYVNGVPVRRYWRENIDGPRRDLHITKWKYRK